MFISGHKIGHPPREGLAEGGFLRYIFSHFFCIAYSFEGSIDGVRYLVSEIVTSGERGGDFFWEESVEVCEGKYKILSRERLTKPESAVSAAKHVKSRQHKPLS